MYSDCVDETINTIKFVERARHIKTKVKQNKYNAKDSKLVNKLRQEIKYLRDILNLRRGGTKSHMTTIQKKLLILQHENDRLREMKNSGNNIEQLIEENRLMKLELQRNEVAHCNPVLF